MTLFLRVALFFCILQSATGFSLTSSSREVRSESRRVSVPFLSPSDDNNKADETTRKIPQLPPVRDSSIPSEQSTVNENKPFVASRKVQLQYTCNVCNTRNTQRIGRVSFYKGVVIARCKGCDTQHLVADHLGWSGFEEQGVLPTTTSVTQEVFELERILKQHDSASGAIVGEDGTPAME